MSAPLTRERIVAAARLWLGTPYQHQASLKGLGCDCLGLVRGVWRDCVGDEPEPVVPYSPDWAEATGREQLLLAGRRHFLPADPAGIRAGDVLLFRWRAHLPAKHLAIATGPDGMIHAHDGAVVAEVAIGAWWRRHLAFSFCFPGLAG